MNTDGWPKPAKEELPEMYDDIDAMIDDIESEIRSHFSTASVDGQERIKFNLADQTTYLEAMDSNKDVMVPFFQKIAGLPDREFDRQYGVEGLGQRLRNLKSSLKGNRDAEAFAEVLVSLMPTSLSIETALYTFFKTWEADQRRFYRMRYEDDFREFLQDQGYPNFKGNDLPGEPDFVIPMSDPYEVVGEVRVIQQKDREKRFKEFRSEATEATKNFPEAKFVAVANIGQYIENHDREQLRAAITKDDDSHIDAAIFQDERKELIRKFEKWGISRQSTLDGLE